MKIKFDFYYEGPLRNNYSWTFHLPSLSFGHGEGMTKGERQLYVAVELFFWSVIVSFTKSIKQEI